MVIEFLLKKKYCINFKIDCHFIWEKSIQKISTPVNSEEQFADGFTKDFDPRPFGENISIL
jgi:hypothetical protein